MSTWADELSDKQLDKLGKEIDSQEFDSVFQVTRAGVVDGPEGIHAPCVYDDPGSDITIDMGPTTGFGWWALSGYTGQDRYNGAVMHRAEFIGGRLAEDIISMSAEAEAEGRPMLWAVVGVSDLDEDDEDENPFGWAVLHRYL